jgi:histidine triad (HIT) family protein
MADDCIFCKILAGEIPSTKVYENDTVYAFRDINPGAPTHILIIPRKHIERVADLDEADAGLVGDLLLAARDIAKQEGVSEAFRLVINNGEGVGQSVFHIHVHLLAGRKLGWPPG